jgi:2-oxoglutarate dehydrogenase E1 component
MILNALQGGAKSLGGDLSQAQADGQKLLMYIRAFMTHGHQRADIDPLKLDQMGSSLLDYKYKKGGSDKTVLDIETYGFTQADLDKKFYVDLPIWSGLLR